MSGNKRRTLSSTLLVVFLLAGCAGTPRPAVMYPQFQRGTARPLVVLIDVALAHDVAGDIDELRLYEGRSVADSLAARLRERLSTRSYRVDKAMLTSMGLTWTATPELNTSAILAMIDCWPQRESLCLIGVSLVSCVRGSPIHT